jgi:hypothetical protein
MSNSIAPLSVPEPKPQRQVSTARPAHPKQNRSRVLRRSGMLAPSIVSVSGGVVPKRRRPRLHPIHFHPALVLSGAAIFAAALVFGGGLLFLRHKDQAPNPYSLAATLGASTTQPSADSETPPSSADLAAYKTAPNEPRLLKISKLHLNAKVMAVEADEKGSPRVLQNIFDTGWFMGSTRPGEGGVVLLNGKVTGSTKPGVFALLENLSAGDVIEVERGDGKTISYKVAALEHYDSDKVTTQQALRPAVADKPGLNLLTAGSRYNVKAGKFEQSLLVLAVQQ